MQLYQKTESDSGTKATTRGGHRRLETILTARTPGGDGRVRDFACVKVVLRALPFGGIVCEVDTDGKRDMTVEVDGKRV